MRTFLRRARTAVAWRGTPLSGQTRKWNCCTWRLSWVPFYKRKKEEHHRINTQTKSKIFNQGRNNFHVTYSSKNWFKSWKLLCSTFLWCRSVQFDSKLTYFSKDKCADGIVGKGLCFVVGYSDIKISLSFVWPILVALCLQEDGKIQ